MGCLLCWCDQSLPNGICLFLVGFPVLADGEDKLPSREALEQLWGSRDVAAGGCGVVAIHAYGCVFLGMQDWGAALAVGCRQDLIFLQEEDACAGFA